MDAMIGKSKFVVHFKRGNGSWEISICTKLKVALEQIFSELIVVKAG